MKSTKTMLIAAMTCSILIAGGSSLRAQESTNMPPVKEHGMKGRSNVAKELNLTDTQKNKFQEITKSIADKRKAVREDTSLKPEEKKTKNKAIQDDAVTQMKALLTPEQFTKWEETTKKMHRNGPPAGSMAPKEAPQH